MQENKFTNGDVTAEKKRRGNIQNLKPFRKGEERQRECALKGGIARGEQIKQRKSLRELANTLLDGHVSRDKAVEILGDTAQYFTDEELTNGAMMLGRLFQETMTNGTIKSAEFIRDTSGQKPKEELSVEGLQTMTEADRALMANIAERLGIKTDN